MKQWILALFILATLPAQALQIKELSVSLDHACAIVNEYGTKNRLECWGDERSTKHFYRLKNSLGFENPTLMNGDFHGLQVLDGRELKFSAGIYSGVYKINTKLKNPRALAIQFLDRVCVLDDEGIKCDFHPPTPWNSDFSEIPKEHLSLNLTLQKNFKNPRQLVSNYFGMCVLDDTGVQCWLNGRNNHERNFVKLKLKTEAMAIAATYAKISILTAEGVESLDFNRHLNLDFPIKPVGKVKSFSADLLACFIDSEGPKCSEPHQTHSAPSFDQLLNRSSDPARVSQGNMLTLGSGCFALRGFESEGLQCWGAANVNLPEELKVDPRNPGNFSIKYLEDALDRLQPHLYSYKAAFLNKVQQRIALIPKPMPTAVGTLAFRQRLFAFNALQPFMEDISTSFFEAQVIPAYRLKLEEANRQAEVRSLLDFSPTPELNVMALGFIADLLESSKTFITQADDRVRLENMIAAGGESIAANGSVASIAKLVALMQNNQALLESLSQSPKTKGLGLMALSLREYLRGQ